MAKSVAFAPACRMSEGAPWSLSDQGLIYRKLAPGHYGRLSMNASPHHSIREPQNVARLSRTFSQSKGRERRGSECALLDCLQIKHKADILVGDSNAS